MDDIIIELYHGSHAEFVKFDMLKIGTGEGTHSEGVGVCLTSKLRYAQRSALTAARKNDKEWNYVYEVTVKTEQTKYWDSDLPLAELPFEIVLKINSIVGYITQPYYKTEIYCIDGIKRSFDFDESNINNIVNELKTISREYCMLKSSDLYNAMKFNLNKWYVAYLLQTIGIDIIKIECHKFVAVNPEILHPKVRHKLDAYSNPISDIDFLLYTESK